MSLQPETPPLILASTSPARRALLEAAGLAFEVIPARIDEDEIKRAARVESTPPEDAAVMLAELKAARVALQRPEALVIGADQILVCNGEWFDKPANLAGARAQLKQLRARAHTLVTAVVCLRGENRLWHHVVTPRLTMRDFSNEFLEVYLTREAATITSSVGGYRLEGLGVHLFDRIEGEHSAILGLPLLPLLGFLRQHRALLA
jgi:septum formation protein